MREVAHNLYVGSLKDFQTLADSEVALEGWAIVHAAKEPYHRKFVGYVSRGAPQDNPEYLSARRGDRLAMNLIDADTMQYVSNQIMDEAVIFVRQKLEEGKKVLIHCNEGCSRAPTLAMLVLAAQLHPEFSEAVNAFKKRYVDYNPKSGVFEYAKSHWPAYYAYGRSRRKL
jgi:predicted protein tyrosine phosphatase